VPKETRGWDAASGTTKPQRGKEEAADYRYFPDPDLVPVTVTEEQIAAVRESLGEFPVDRRNRYAVAYQLSEYDIKVLVDQGKDLGDYFEEVAATGQDGKVACNWITQDVLREMNERKLTIQEFPISAPVLGNLLKRIHAKQITTKSAREVFVDLLDGQAATAERIDTIIADRGLAIVSDTGAIDKVIEAVIARNPKPVADFKSGKQAALGSLIGQVMKEVKGADPQTVRERLVATLSK
jgi:aspartyl-tRNA(Asn)/glutamyl-tRNA(Gln) amidotransferase subunit B